MSVYRHQRILIYVKPVIQKVRSRAATLRTEDSEQASLVFLLVYVITIYDTTVVRSTQSTTFSH